MSKTTDAKDVSRSAAKFLAAADQTLSYTRCQEAVNRLFSDPIGGDDESAWGFNAPLHVEEWLCNCLDQDDPLYAPKDFCAWDHPTDEDKIVCFDPYSTVTVTPNNLAVFCEQTYELGGVPLDEHGCDTKFFCLTVEISRFFWTLSGITNPLARRVKRVNWIEEISEINARAER